MQLEKLFEQGHYPSQLDRTRLAANISLSVRQITTWFQNRRSKWRRQHNVVGKEHVTMHPRAPPPTTEDRCRSAAAEQYKQQRD